MFRILSRVVLLLAVAGLVAGAVYLLVNATRGGTPPAGADRGRGSTAAASAGIESRGSLEHEGERGSAFEGEGRGRRRGWNRERAFSSGERGEEREGGGRVDGGGHGGHGEFSPGRGLGGLLVTSLQIAVVAAVVVGVQRLVRRPSVAQPTTSAPSV